MLKSVSSKPPSGHKLAVSKSPQSSVSKVTNAHHVKTTNQHPHQHVAKTSNHSVARTPSGKSGPRSCPPAPQLTVIRYIIDNDVLKCPVCLEVFKSPRVIPCGHSLCFDCLNSIILYNDSSNTVKDTFHCPVCHKIAKPRDTKVIRQRWATQFPVNSVLQRLLRNASLKNNNDTGTHKAFCGVCLMNNMTRPVIAYCNTCLEHQCETCSKYHFAKEDAHDHDVTFYVDKDAENEKTESNAKNEISRKSKITNEHRVTSARGRKVKVGSASRDGKLAPVSNVIVAQTITAADKMLEKHVVKLGQFNGNAPNDSATSDFRSIAFITNTKVVLADHANKKIKVFDVAHKTRVELIADLSLRADPTHMSRVNESTVAVITERSGVFHIRLFTIRDKISHSVHRTIDGVPLGIGAIQNTIVCSFLDQSSLVKYRLTRAQQQKIGLIQHDRSGNEIFHHPGAMCSGMWQGMPAIMVADETEFGVTVMILDSHGDRKSSVFFECEFPKPRTAKKSANGVPKTTKSGKPRSSKAGRKDEASDTTNESELAGTIKSTGRKQTTKQAESQVSEDTAVQVSGRHTFRRIDEYGRVTSDRKGGREIERPTMSATLKSELSIDLNKLNTDLSETIGRSSKKQTRNENKAVERAQKRPVGKVIPQQMKTGSGRVLDKNQNENLDSALNPSSTVTSDSTIGTVSFATPPKLVYRADSITMDNIGNIYVCMSSFNKIHQMSPDGRVKRDLLTEKDGLVAPKAISFSPKNDVILVTCLKSNRVNMFRFK